jgi:branched-chain amino acid aminotransferase
VQANAEYIPPYGTGASLYLRPLLIGTGAQVGVKESNEYTFVVFVTPVGPYFKEGFKPITVTLERTYDRAAPRGTGHTKVGGNYAASIGSGSRAHEAGFANCLYLDPSEKKYIDEFGAANFFGIKEGKYVTPDSHSVLPSITNMSLRTLAEDLGLKVENRPIPVEELATFEETGACGTAAVISHVGRIFDPLTGEYFEYGTEAGPWSVKLYNLLQDIQYGRAEDKHGWTKVVEL